MGVNFSAQCNITNPGYDMPAYVLWKWMHSPQFKEEWKSMGEKWKERKKNSWWQIFQQLQAAFISQLIETGTGFIDCKVFFFLSYTELNISNWK